MDEHIVVDQANAKTLCGDLTDENLNDITWWTNKHTGYAIREVYEMVRSEHQESLNDEALTGEAHLKRLLKNKIYNKLPGGVRGILYFVYRYFFGLGFLDGKSGFYFHFLQAFWYRVFVDAKMHELNMEAKAAKMSTYELLRERGIL
jgi:hypothetical protein